MADLKGFDATTHEPAAPREGFEIIPNGTYLAIITDSEMKATKTGTGNYLELVVQIIEEGKHQGRKLWSRLNVINASEKAQTIGLAELSAVCRAVKILRPSDSSELHNKPLFVVVRVTKDKQTQEPRNEVSGWLSVEDGNARKATQGQPQAPQAFGSRPPAQPAQAAAGAAPATPPPQTAQAPTNSPPWKR